MRVLLTGATSYVGRRLKVKLLDEKDVSLRLLVRDARQVSESTTHRVEIVEGDILNREAVLKAVEGVDVVYYPIRFFGALWESEGFDRAVAEEFRDICIDAGVKRLIYAGLHVSEHASIELLRNINETGEILSARPDAIQTVWLRGGALLGAGSVMFELLRNIVREVPVIVCSRWMDTEIDFAGVHEVLEYLVKAKDLEVTKKLIIDIGSGQMSFKQMLKLTAKEMGMKRIFIPLPFAMQHLSSFLLMLATPFSFRLSSILIRALESGEIRSAGITAGAGDVQAQRYFPGVAPISFEYALHRAMHELESDGVLSRWVDTLDTSVSSGFEEELERARFRDIKTMGFGDLPPQKIFRAVKSIGGREGWFTFDLLWRIRGLLDKLAGGYGTAMGKRAASDLRVGDMLDVWKVVDLQEDRRLLLEAQMKVFGKAWLEFRIEGETLIQIASHYPKGIPGKLYWYCMLPFHVFIFRDMIRNIIRQAREMD